MRAAIIGGLLLGATPAALAAPRCDNVLGRLESADKRTFAVDSYGTGAWTERHGGRSYTYFVHAWRGNEAGAPRILTFTEIPSTSGPNWGSARDSKELKPKMTWRRLDAAKLEDFIRVYGGPLEGEWTLACQGRPPIKVNFPRYAEYPADKAYNGRIAKMKVPRGLDEEIRLRLTEALQDDRKPEIGSRYIRLTWPCGSTCVGGALMDARTGRVIMLPYMSGWGEVADGFEPIDGRLDSRLVVLSGARNERGLFGRHFYVLENGRLRHLRSVEVERSFPQKVE